VSASVKATAATGYTSVPITTPGNPSRMEDDPRAAELDKTRRYLRRRLTPLRTQSSRIINHLDHMDAGDLDRIHALLEREHTLSDLADELKAIHDTEQCERDMERQAAEDAEQVPWWQTLRDAFRDR
jgi:hypothetical protein